MDRRSIRPSRSTRSRIRIRRSPTSRACRRIEDDVRKLGVNTFPIPLGLKLNEADPLASKCVRCDTCDGYPCLVHAKSDADINCIRQILHLPNVTLMTNSRVTRLLTNAMRTAVTAVEVEHSGRSCMRRTSRRRRQVITRASVLCLRRGDQLGGDAAGVGERQASARAGELAPTRSAGTSCITRRTRCWRSRPSGNEDTYTKTWGTNDFYLRDTDRGLSVSAGPGAAGRQLSSRDDEGGRASADAGLRARRR